MKNLCVCCGVPIPEGRQVCKACENHGKEQKGGYIDRQKFIDYMEKALITQRKYGTFREVKQSEFFIQAIQRQPAADVVEVVRCKDCKHRYSSKFCECRPANAYCSDGERKSGVKE